MNGKKILITRAAHQSAGLAQLIVKHGGVPVLFPMIEIIPPPSWDSCDKAIDALYMYDGLIFTSVNGVEFFFRRVHAKGVSLSAFTSKIICVVGEKTKAIAEEHGLTVTLMPEKFTADDLFKALMQEDVAGKSFLHPKGNLGKDYLSGNLTLLGSKVESVVVYNTIQPAQTDMESIKAQLLDGGIEWITFTSPSSVHNFVSLFTSVELSQIIEGTSVAVIGPVTKKAAELNGFQHSMMAEESTLDSLVKIITASIHD